MPDPQVHSGPASAVISEDGVYRYRLDRRWPEDDLFGTKAGYVCWVMLNPSTADERADDPTIRRCVGYTGAWGFSHLVVVNLFALRATDPRELVEHADPIGPENARWLNEATIGASLIIAAWGSSWPRQHAVHVGQIRRRLAQRRAQALGLTKEGHPRHPLYLRRDAERIELAS